MAIAFRAQTTPAGAAADPIAAPALPAGTITGDMVILHPWVRASAITINAPASWQNPADNEVVGGAGAEGADSGTGRIKAFFREYDGVWFMPTIDLSAAPNNSLCGATSFSKGAGEVWEPVVCAVAADGTGSTTIYDPPAAVVDLDLTAGDVLVAMSGINGDAGAPNAVTVITCAGCTVGTVNRRINTGATTGFDTRLITDDAAITGGPSTAGPDLSISYTTANANMAGATVFARLRVSTPPAGDPFTVSQHTRRSKRKRRHSGIWTPSDGPVHRRVGGPLHGPSIWRGHQAAPRIGAREMGMWTPGRP